MRVLQLIDSLLPGGAERMAVSYANALNGRIDASFLCCTRMEGMLQKKLDPEVGYLFLEKKSTLDSKSFFRLRKFIEENRIDLIQAHSSSFFLAVLVKLSLPKVKLIWHDHYGRDLDTRKPGILKQASRYFDGIISVNAHLKEWAVDNLYSEEVKYVKNFLPEPASEKADTENLKGQAGFNIICLANLRPQKDHLNLLMAFSLLSEREINLHLIGKDEKDDYSRSIKKFLQENDLEKRVFLYGSRENVEDLLKKADLAVLSSASEGLPVALLEYGLAGLPVICTRVGECEAVIGENGILVSPHDPKELADAISYYIDFEQKKRADASNFQREVRKAYSEDTVIPDVLEFMKYIVEKQKKN
ncbi:glycosyltransferase [Salinimicrobium sp. GXAS 041]|uniref:glycosyltransferase n=1 Tax=Salinimicrobium sp. GXAS 041 TaxID=3400806 RepID=UPI003C735A6D